jgi:hypothetical protein
LELWRRGTKRQTLSTREMRGKIRSNIVSSWFKARRLASSVALRSHSLNKRKINPGGVGTVLGKVKWA